MNHLKGKIPDMLKTKSLQVFRDYIAGGQNKRIAVERAANAQSQGVLSMAERNACGVEVEPPATVDAPAVITEEQLAMIKEGRGELEAVKALVVELSQLKGLPETLKEVKQGYAELKDTKLHYAQKEHEQQQLFAGQAREMEQKEHEQKLKFAEEIQAFEVKKRKQNMELDEEEAQVAERCRVIREGRREQLREGGSQGGEPDEDMDRESFDPPDAEDTEDEFLCNYDCGMEYNKAAEAGMDKEAVQERRRLWKQLQTMSEEYPSAWQPLSRQLAVVSPAMEDYEKQLKFRLAKYQEENALELDSCNSQRKAYLNKVGVKVSFQGLSFSSSNVV